MTQLFNNARKKPFLSLEFKHNTFSCCISRRHRPRGHYDSQQDDPQQKRGGISNCCWRFLPLKNKTKKNEDAKKEEEEEEEEDFTPSTTPSRLSLEENI